MISSIDVGKRNRKPVLQMKKLIKDLFHAFKLVRKVFTCFLLLGQSAPSTPSQETKDSTPSGTPATSTPTQGETQKKRGRPGNSTPAAAASTPTTEVRLKVDQIPKKYKVLEELI